MNKKQKQFVDEYLIDLNATQAAIRAGYSPKYADRMGYKLVENSRVSDAK
ncbi:terminase small subunit [Pelotomaculum terephthalicicum]